MGEAAASAVAAMMPKRMKVRASMALQSRANRESANFPAVPAEPTGATNRSDWWVMVLNQDERCFYFLFSKLAAHSQCPAVPNSQPFKHGN
jgi:hypothetical protein